MVTKTIITHHLIASDGKWLTQSNLEYETNRIFSHSVYVPDGHEDEWEEVDDLYKTHWTLNHLPDINQPDEPTEE